ncbi:hypothetical protein D3C71_1527910 [compost metagenome]
MQVILLRLLVVLPYRTAEYRLPIIRRTSVCAGVPNIVIPVRVIFGASRLHEPIVLVGGMIHDQVHDQLHAAFMHVLEQLLPIGHCPELIHNVAIIADVVAVIVIWRLIDGREPDNIGAKFLNVVKLGYDALKIPDAVSVGIFEAAGIYLINNAFFPPIGFLHMNLHVEHSCEVLRHAPALQRSFILLQLRP